MDKISCIVLNYKDADTTLALAAELETLKTLDTVVVVDNCSPDDSWERLQILKERRPGFFHLLRTGENGGYGQGNQQGIDYVRKNLKADYIIVANPDIHVTDRCIRRVKAGLDRTEGCALASASVVSPEGTPLFSFWQILPWWKDLLDTGPICRRLFKPWLNVRLSRLPHGGIPGSYLVDAVCGSFFMLRTDRISDKLLGRLFDPQVFLYCEEKILGKKLQAAGLKTLLVRNTSYVHAHSVSIDKSLSKIAEKQKLLHQSKLYYYKNYLHAGPAAMAAARVFLAIVQAEVWFLTEVCGIRW